MRQRVNSGERFRRGNAITIQIVAQQPAFRRLAASASRSALNSLVVAETKTVRLLISRGSGCAPPVWHVIAAKGNGRQAAPGAIPITDFRSIASISALIQSWNATTFFRRRCVFGHTK